MKTQMRKVKKLTNNPAPWRGKAWKDGEYAGGGTEPWVGQLVAEFCAAKHARVVLELGGHKGLTSLAIAERMASYGGGQLIIVELDKDNCDAITKRFRDNPASHVGVLSRLVNDDALTAIATLPVQSVDVAFVDDDHYGPHVEAEIQALLPKMARGGIILMHDVTGAPDGDLDCICRRYGGVVLDLPRMHITGGLGIISKETL